MHANPLHGNREVPEATDSLSTIGPVEEGKGRDLNMHVTGKSDGGIVCAGQRPDQDGSSPSGARMRGAISEGGGNSSLAGERE